MQESEAKKILMALDGLAAYLETIRNLVVSSIEAPAEQPVKPKKIIDMIPNEECLHPDTLEIETLGGVSAMCNGCGQQL
jgi:hypothetical protein